MVVLVWWGVGLAASVKKVMERKRDGGERQCSWVWLSVALVATRARGGGNAARRGRGDESKVGVKIKFAREEDVVHIKRMGWAHSGLLLNEGNRKKRSRECWAGLTVSD